MVNTGSHSYSIYYLLTNSVTLEVTCKSVTFLAESEDIVQASGTIVKKMTVEKKKERFKKKTKTFFYKLKVWK